MVEVNDLWVGDSLRLIKSGRVGKYVGTSSDNRIRISLGEKIILAKLSNIEIVKEKTENEKLTALKKENLQSKINPTPFESQIDLHIEKLKPNLKNAIPERIIDIQIKSFEEYLEKAIKMNKRFLTIIHGKGTGVLRSHIHTYLKSMDEVHSFHSVNNDGATEVVLK